VLSLVVGSAALLGCGGQETEPRKLGRPNVHPTTGCGGFGSVGGAGGSGGCIPPDENASVSTLGLHARIDGTVGHFTRDVSALYGYRDGEQRYEFTVIGWKGCDVCGASNMTLWVTSPTELPGPGVYPCTRVGSAEPAPYLLVGAPFLAQSGESDCTIELTEVGRIVAGTFSGTLASSAGASLEVTEGRFRVEITE
jgi:hypothetical protein